MKRHARLVAVVSISVFVSGCADYCEVQGSFTVHWREPGLFAHLAGLGSNASVNVSLDPPDGFLLHNETLDDRYGAGNHRVHSVRWRPGTAGPDGHPAWEQEPSLQGPGIVQAQWASIITNETARLVVRDFIENVTGEPRDQVDRLADAFMANKTGRGIYLTEDPAKGGKPIHTYVAKVDVGRWVQMARLWNETHARGEATAGLDDPDPSATPTWVFTIDVARIVVQPPGGQNVAGASPGVNIDRWSWTASANDAASFGREDATSESSVRQELQRIRSMVGLGPLPLATVMSPSEQCWR